MPACAGDLPLPIYHSCALPSELYGIPYILQASPKPSELFCPFGHPFLSSFAFCFSFRLLLCHSNHSTFNSHNFPRTYTTTYPYVAAPPQPNALTRKARRFGTYRSRLLSFLWPYFIALFHAVSFLATRDWSLSLPFQLRVLHVPFRDYSPPILPLCIQYIQPTCRDCTPHVPRRLWKVAESNRLLILSSLGIHRRGVELP